MNLEEWKALLTRAEAQRKGFENALEEGFIVIKAYKERIKELEAQEIKELEDATAG